MATLGTMAFQNASNVDITGGKIDNANISNAVINNSSQFSGTINSSSISFSSIADCDITIKQGSTNLQMPVGGVAYKNLGYVANSGATLSNPYSDLMTYSMEADTLSEVGSFIEVEGFGYVDPTDLQHKGIIVEFKGVFGTYEVFRSTYETVANSSWWVQAKFIRINNTQDPGGNYYKVISSFLSDSVQWRNFANFAKIPVNSTFPADIKIRCRCEQNNVIVQAGLIVKMFNG